MSNGETNGNGTGKWASRKFALVVRVFLITTLLLVRHFVLEATWLTVTLGVIGAYITGNVVQGVLNK